MPALPPRISAAAHSELTKLGVRVLTQTMVTSADEGGLHTKDGEYIEADLMVWAAGIKAPDFLNEALNVTLVEAGERILPALPPRISAAAHNELTKLGVRVLTQTMVTSAVDGGLHNNDGEYIEAYLWVWAAGKNAPDFLKDIGGLETNRINHLVVEPTLQTTRDPDIYAIGDCASCPRPEGGFVPPRAQAAHQMATCAMNNILAQMNGKPLKNYQYKDHGSLVSLSNFSTVGSLMGNLTRGSMMIEGRIARFVYISLYRMHQIALHGYFKTGLMMLVGSINRVIRPRLKLH